MKNLNKKNKGFTLIEILVVIGIIAILAAIVIIAINPKKAFDDAKTATRKANIGTIQNAIGQYVVAKKGTLPTIPTTAAELTPTLCKELVPEFTGSLPTDPDSTNWGGNAISTSSECDDLATKPSNYTVGKTGERVTVCATNPTPDICLTR